MRIVGSAYSYSYITIGEFVAWIIGISYLIERDDTCEDMRGRGGDRRKRGITRDKRDQGRRNKRES